MAAPKGNQYWRFAENIGRPKDYQPDILWLKAQEYFDWCIETPWHKNEAIKGGDNAGMIIQIPTAKPFTLKGFCLFASIDFKTFENYSANKDFVHITTRIREICFTQKFEGAAVGAFNANLIARDLGLSDKSELNVEGDWTISMNINGGNKVQKALDAGLSDKDN